MLNMVTFIKALGLGSQSTENPAFKIYRKEIY